jgi:hypothetical protein
MYLRHAIRKKDGKAHRYWCLVRSVRVGAVLVAARFQREDRVKAHILVCFLAFVLWKSLEMW